MGFVLRKRKIELTFTEASSMAWQTQKLLEAALKAREINDNFIDRGGKK